jgi:hypothetical protein
MRRSYFKSTVSAGVVAAALTIAPLQVGSAGGFAQALAAVSPAAGKQPAKSSNSATNFNQGTKDAGAHPNSQVDEEYVPR